MSTSPARAPQERWPIWIGHQPLQFILCMRILREGGVQLGHTRVHVGRAPPPRASHVGRAPLPRASHVGRAPPPRASHGDRKRTQSSPPALVRTTVHVPPRACHEPASDLAPGRMAGRPAIRTCGGAGPLGRPRRGPAVNVRLKEGRGPRRPSSRARSVEQPSPACPSATKTGTAQSARPRASTVSCEAGSNLPGTCSAAATWRHAAASHRQHARRRMLPQANGKSKPNGKQQPTGKLQPTGKPQPTEKLQPTGKLTNVAAGQQEADSYDKGGG
eukprot:350559-Chlamydomonas_euryale.AAC.6